MLSQKVNTPEIKEEELAALWEFYKTTGDVEAKNDLLLHYTGLVKRIVRRMMPKYNTYNDYDDLVNCGIIGLIDAVERYDLKHDVKFETYAMTRVRGEIMDYMRSQDWAPSSLRKKINAISAAYEKMEAVTGQTPTDEVVARELDMDASQVQKIQAQTHMFNLVNFEDTLSSCYAVNEVAAPEDEAPENVLMGKEMKKYLAQIIDELPEKERLVITLYYYEELMLKEIADILNVSESRVSQIHSKVLAKMRAKLQKAM